MLYLYHLKSLGALQAPTSGSPLELKLLSDERAARFHLEQFYHSCCGMKNCEPRYQFSKLITELVVHISS